jgi:lysophospholipase L1-like esterase
MGLPGACAVGRMLGLACEPMGARASIAVLLGSFLVGAAYGYFLHRNQIFPYKVLNPAPFVAVKPIVPEDSPSYRTRTAAIAAFQAAADVVMLGDSLTETIDWRAAFPGLTVSNQGISLDTTVGMLARVSLANATGAHVIAVMAGINDLLRGAPVDQVLDRYRQLINRLRAPGRCIIVQSTLLTRRGDALNASVRVLNEGLRATCQGGDSCQFLDLNAVLAPETELPSSLTVDGLHLTGQGYRLWRDALLPAFAKCRE